MNHSQMIQGLAEAAVALSDAKDRIHDLNEALLEAQNRNSELEKLVEQQRKTMAHLKETIRQGKYIRLSERGRSL